MISVADYTSTRKILSVTDTLQTLHKLTRAIERLRMEVLSLSDRDGFEEIDVDAVTSLLTEARLLMLDEAPFTYCECPLCNRHNCDICKGRGWLTVEQSLRLAVELSAACPRSPPAATRYVV